MSDPISPPSPAPEASGAPAPAPAVPPIDIPALQKEIADLRQEAAGYRLKAKEQAEAAAKAAEKEDALGAANTEMTRLKQYEGAVKAEVEALTKKLGDKVPASVQALDPMTALGILKSLETAFAGPGAAKPTTNGHPAGPTMPVDLATMNQDERRRYLYGLPHDELVKLNGGGPAVSPLAAPFKK